jgi:lipopolysaccharide/colanic/teichoic acid biosynthesis glycosyltransferase
MGKRIFDILVAGLGLLVLLPVFVLIALLIVFDSRGRVFFLQERVGLHFRVFKLWKFRTMYTGSHKQSAITVGKRDSRITRVGYWLRKFKIDELPQLVNVLLGDMSLVGPRPEVRKFVDLYTPEQRKILAVRPGLTDFASIEFRNENELLEGKADPVKYYVEQIMPHKLSLNSQYLREQSFWIDLRILLKTIFLIVSGK